MKYYKGKTSASILAGRNLRTGADPLPTVLSVDETSAWQHLRDGSPLSNSFIKLLICFCFIMSYFTCSHVFYLTFQYPFISYLYVSIFIHGKKKEQIRCDTIRR